MSTNQFICHIGYVVEDKEYMSKKIKVYVPEILPFATSPNDNTQEQSVEVEDLLKELKTTDKIKSSNILVADYFDLATNRSGPPDIRQGEQVAVIQIHSTDSKFYWFPLGRDDNLRRLERLRYSISDDPTVQKELNDDNTYFIELDTLHHKHIRIKTSKSDGESYAYTFHIDAIANTVMINDDSGNEIFMDSNVPRIRLKNRSKSFLDILDQDIIIGAARDVVLKANRQVLYNAPAMTLMSDGGTTTMKSDNLTLAASNINLNGSTVGLSGAIKLVGSILSSAIVAEGYSTGSAGGAYPAGDVSLEDGSPSTPAPSSDSPDTSSNRTSTAHEDLTAAFEDVRAAFEEIQGVIGVPVVTTLNNIDEHIAAAPMPKNKGE